MIHIGGTFNCWSVFQLAAQIPRYFGPLRPQGHPIASLGSGCEIALSEGFHIIISYALGLLRVQQEVLHSAREIGEVSLDFDIVLLWTGRYQEIMVMLDVLQFMGDEHRWAGLPILQRG